MQRQSNSQITSVTSGICAAAACIPLQTHTHSHLLFCLSALTPGDFHRNPPSQDKGWYCAGSIACPQGFEEDVRWRGWTAKFRRAASVWSEFRSYAQCVATFRLCFRLLVIFWINIPKSPWLIRPRTADSATPARNAPWPWSCRPPLASPWRQSRAAFPRSGRATPLRRWGALRRNARLLPWRILTWREETLIGNNSSFRLCGVRWTSRFQVLRH